MDKLLGMLGVIAIFFIDRYSKIWAIGNLKSKKPIGIIDGVFELTYVENRGAAFGLLQNQRVLFAVITVVVVGFILLFYCKLENKKRFFALKATLVVLTGGILGNFYERMLNGYVVDMFHFYWFEYPVFNVADICIVVSSLVLCALLIFYYDDKEINVRKIIRR